MHQTQWAEIKELLTSLYTAKEGLEGHFPGRKFTLDGHLVGSIGEVVAAYVFDLELLPASHQGHDARARDGRLVEIKFTQGKSVALRGLPAHLIVLQRAIGTSTRIVYNGPGRPVWGAAGKTQKNGQRPISIAKLTALDAEVVERDRLSPIRAIPI